MMLVAAFVLSLMMVPVVRWFSFQVGRVDRPREDRWHRQPTPKLGGMGMFAAFALSLATAGLYHPAWSGLEARWSILVGAVLMFALGLYDDFKRIHPPAKLAGQMVAATIVIFFGGYTIDFFP